MLSDLAPTRVDAGDDVVAVPIAEPPPEPQPRRRRRKVGFWVAVGWLAVIIAVSLTADLLPLRAPSEAGVAGFLQNPSLSWPEFLGTDALGRSQLSRLVYGGRVSLLVGLGAVALALVVGGTIGVLAGYFRGRLERVVDLLTDSALAIPALVLLLTISAVFGQLFRNLVLSLAFLVTPAMIRLARANTLAYAHRDFVVAARALGAKDRRIIAKEIVPNVVLPLLSMTFITIGVVMVAEGSLSFLGRGIPPPTSSWGGMIAAGRAKLETHPAQVFVPAAALFVTVLALNTVGDRLRGRFENGTDDR